MVRIFRRKRRRFFRHVPRVFSPSYSSGRSLNKFLLAAVLVLIAACGFLLLRSDIFQVKKMDFEFEQLADEALVRQRILEEVVARSIFFLNSQAVEENIKADFPTIKSVGVEKKLPDRVFIRVAVRVPLAIVQDGSGEKFLVDEEGFLFREAQKEKLPVIKLGESFEGQVGDFVSGEGVAGYLETLDLAAEKGLETKAIFLRSSTIELKLKKTTVWLDAENKISPQIDLLTQLLQRYKLNGKVPKSVDLRFARPVVRL
ncbi:MAG TPA: FtsQ-type POTRA domain-containing protein [candidate division WWE3 bacterium]|uniref:FtsQ-type POTRA domain-containing protein n=1 Tax=candidate division WWE3 bacterium TaxID=2053526 RepID=A0A7C1SQ47_UNCKA|nr:FtsQ-type POTRA domain-containing protein [candidate division WWE3 bacterium]